MTATTKKKYVTKEVLEDFSLPDEHQMILRIVKSRGNNLHQVVSPSGEEFLVSMPPKFRKHIWVKRGSYVIAEEIPEGNKVKAEIVRILLHDQIKHFKENNVWPEAFNEDDTLKNYEIDEALLPKFGDSDDDDDSEGELGTFVQYNPNKYLLPHALDNLASDNDKTDDESEESDSDESRSNSDQSEKQNGDESTHVF